MTLSEPQALHRNEHFCQVRTTTELNSAASTEHIPIIKENTTPISCPSDTIKIDPDCMLPDSYRAKFQDMVTEFDEVFSPELPRYNGALGSFEATINMGPGKLEIYLNLGMKQQ